MARRQGDVMTKNAVYGLQIVFGLIVIAAGLAKLAGAGMMVREFEVIGLGQGFRVIFGACEIAGGLLLFVPRLAMLGVAMLACLMVGATGAAIARVADARIEAIPVNGAELAMERTFRIGSAPADRRRPFRPAGPSGAEDI